jgi:F-type H+-transporting ATPase subunit 8
MPQLLPFFFVNQLVFTFAGFATMVYIFATYILPVYVEVSVARSYITKL